jgi:hypothetical protein
MCTTLRVSLVIACIFLLGPFAGRADVPARVVRFDDIKPAGAILNSTFEAIGLDPQERVYATLCNGSAANGDCYLFRWDRKTGKRQYLGSLVQSARKVGNIGPNRYWPKKEAIIKGHTHNVYLDGRIWMGTMNVHGYENPAEHRGIHIFGYDLATGVLTDHSQWQPKGVFKQHSGMYALDAHPQKNLLVGIGPVDCEIITYNPRTRETKRIPGSPREDNPQLSGRSMTIVGSKVIYQCGSARTPLSIYDLNTKKNRPVDFPGNVVLTQGYVPTRDGKKVYISDLKTIYEFNTQTERFRTVTTFDPAGTPREVSPPALSRDEKKLYYVINLTNVNGGAYINDLYEFNLVTGTRTKIMNLKKVLGGGAKVSGTKATASDGKMYFVFNSNQVGILEIDVSNR